MSKVGHKGYLVIDCISQRFHLPEVIGILCPMAPHLSKTLMPSLLFSHQSPKNEPLTARKPLAPPL
jgi:hypothetical protein